MADDELEPHPTSELTVNVYFGILGGYTFGVFEWMSSMNDEGDQEKLTTYPLTVPFKKRIS
jgi:hypothetical protein